jgi:hypothetical protein
MRTASQALDTDTEPKTPDNLNVLKQTVCKLPFGAGQADFACYKAAAFAGAFGAVAAAGAGKAGLRWMPR